MGNGFLPTGDRPANRAFRIWRAFATYSPWFPVGRIVNSGCVNKLSPGEIAAYDAPFPDGSFVEGARQFPALVPTSPDDPEAPANRAAWEVLAAFERPFVCAFGDSDPITAGNERHLISRIKGAEGQPHTAIEGGGHFLQEDRGEEIGALIADWLASG